MTAQSSGLDPSKSAAWAASGAAAKINTNAMNTFKSAHDNLPVISSRFAANLPDRVTSALHTRTESSVIIISPLLVLSHLLLFPLPLPLLRLLVLRMASDTAEGATRQRADPSSPSRAARTTGNRSNASPQGRTSHTTYSRAASYALCLLRRRRCGCRRRRHWIKPGLTLRPRVTCEFVFLRLFIALVLGRVDHQLLRHGRSVKQYDYIKLMSFSMLSSFTALIAGKQKHRTVTADSSHMRFECCVIRLVSRTRRSTVPAVQ